MITGKPSDCDYWYEWDKGFFHNPNPPKSPNVVHVDKGELLIMFSLEEYPDTEGWIVNHSKGYVQTPCPSWLDII